MLSAIYGFFEIIIGFLETLFSFTASLFTGLWNLIRMIPQTFETVALFNYMFPAWAYAPIMSIISIVIALAILKWIKGII